MYKPYLTLTFLFLSMQVWAQFPSLSPAAVLEQEVGATNIRITYERPAARGRAIFGSLVPYGNVWRTGAGNCTKIRFSRPVMVGTTSVPAGTYSLFSIPDVKSWTLILNRDTTLYGSGRYTSASDVVRLSVPVRSTMRFYESLTFDIDVVPNNAVIYLSWADTQVSFLVGTDTDKTSMALITSSLLTEQSMNSEEYGRGAEYLYYLDRDLDSAVTLVSRAITLRKELWYYRLKIDILARQRKFKEAVVVADDAIKWIDSRQDLTSAQKSEYRGEYERRKKDLQ